MNHTVGQTIGGYVVRRVAPLEKISGQYVELEHPRTGARHVHIACADDNNAFLVAFPTVPKDSTGVAHILEHCVLTGSKKYPVRDPFFAMLPRSLATFMNAMTGSDTTYYPFSTRNTKDFYNLLNVYLDACFFPELDYLSFKQEGWRFEFEERNNPQSALTYKGVVYNEMKGAMSSVPSIMYRAVGRAIFPDLTYANNSGGDPRHIPDLSYEQLKHFHATHYHPSNSFFYSYGNQPLVETLEQIEKNALDHFEKIEINTSIPNQTRFPSPKRLEAAYPLAENEDPSKKTQVLMTWLTSPSSDSFQMLAWRVLERVLLSNAASPLRKALIESQLGDALADTTGFEDSPKEAIFSVGLKGIAASAIERVEALILSTLQEVVSNGVDVAAVEAAIHRLEIESREVSNAGYPYGLKVFFDLSNGYMRGGDPLAGLDFDADLARLAQARNGGRFFENLIQKQLLDNPHRATVVLTPDHKLHERQEQEEHEKLVALHQSLDAKTSQRIVEEANALEEKQAAPEDRNVLPTLGLQDVPMTLEDVAHEVRKVDGSTLGLFPQPTNGLSYIDLSFDFSHLSQTQKELLPTLAFLLTRMGGGPSDYLAMAARIEAHTGGVGASVSTRTAPHDLNKVSQNFTVSAKALYRKHDELFAILSDFLLRVRFDRDHTRNLLQQLRAGMESQLVQAGHMFAMRLASAQLNAAGALRERLEGLTQMALTKERAALTTQQLEDLLTDLEDLAQTLFVRQGLAVCVTSEGPQLQGLATQAMALIAAFPAGNATGTNALPEPLPHQAQARTTAVPVAYNAQQVLTVPYTHADAPALMALAGYLRERYTHPEIREKGGAYGGFAVHARENGVFTLASYRDPHIKRTFDVFQNAANFVAKQNISDEDFQESVLQSCRDLDPLLSPDTKGRNRFYNDLEGYNLALRLEFKKRLLALQKSDLLRVAQTYLGNNPVRAVVSNDNKIAEANQEMGAVFEVKAI